MIMVAVSPAAVGSAVGAAVVVVRAKAQLTHAPQPGHALLPHPATGLVQPGLDVVVILKAELLLQGGDDLVK